VGGVAVALAGKDLRTEFRSRSGLAALLVSQVLIVLALSFTVSLQDDPQRRQALLLEVTPGVLWVTVLLAGVLVLPRSMGREVDQGTLDLLLISPLRDGQIFAGKFLANLALQLLAVAAALVLMTVFLEFSPGGLLPYLMVPLLLGAVAMAALGTLISAVAAQTTARQVLVLILLVPGALYSIVLPGITATELILAPQAEGPVRALAALGGVALASLALGSLLFGFALRE